MSTILTVRLGTDTKARFAAHCKASGTTPSAAVRDVVLSLIGPPDAPDPPAQQQAKAIDEGDKCAVRVFLTEPERDALDRHVAHVGGSRSALIVRAIRGVLTHEPQFGDDELAAIGCSNDALLRIGRSLDDIARRMPSEAISVHITAKAIADLGRRIEQHVETAHRLMRASRERWPLAPAETDR